MRQTRSSCVSGEDTREAEMQNGHRWVVREKTTGKWVKSADDISGGGAVLTDDLAEALRYGTRFRAEDDAKTLTRMANRKDDSWLDIRGMLFEVYEFADSDRARQVLPYRVFTPETKEE